MRSILSATSAQLAASILATLGLQPLAGCGSSVETTEGSGGATSSSSSPTTGSTSTGDTTGSTSTGSPDHPPTCEELSTSASVAATTVGVASSGAGGGDLYARPCDNPTPRQVGCLDTGVDQCEQGFLVRREAVDCPAWHRPAAEWTCSDGTGVGECAIDADCGEGSICDAYFAGPPAGDGCRCTVACVEDADCGDGMLCLCGEGGGECVVATCRTDDECGAGLRCASISTGGCEPTLEFHCQTAEDACGTAGECPNDGMGETGCGVDGNGVRVCDIGYGCAAVGRPFVVEGELRCAPIALRDDWQAALTVAEVSPAQRAALAAAWAQVGAMEHASVASFARFSMDLMAHGAPPELLSGAAQAMLDEVEHARLAFGLASSFGGGANVGPGPLDLAGTAPASTLVELAVATFLEGCLGEGAAATEAAVAAAQASDAGVRAVLGQVAREEATHAELAWKTIAWALAQGGERVALALESALVAAEQAPRAAGPEPRLEAWGILGERERGEIRAETLRGVVRPVLARLLAQSTDAVTVSDVTAFASVGAAAALDAG